MVNQIEDDLSSAFHALADPTRRAILARLARGEAPVGELAQPFAMSAPAITKHLKVLERAGLVRRRVEGRVHHCRLEAGPLTQAQSWIDEHRAIWERQFDRLARFLERTADSHDTKQDDTNDEEDPTP